MKFDRVLVVTTMRFLIIDHDPDSAELLVRSLRRKFPHATLMPIAEVEEATKVAASLQLAAVVLHRASDGDAVGVTRALRSVNTTAPIIVVSGIDRSESVLAAGATGFLNFDQWQMLGAVVDNSMAVKPA
jgi:DNA-binding response OmpR family regulator